MSTTARKSGVPMAFVPVVPGVKPPKKLAPKIEDYRSLRPQEQSTISVVASSSTITHPKQDQPPSPTFEFINTTTDVQYSGPGSRSVARSHVMRNFHKRKGKSRLEHTKPCDPGLSLQPLYIRQRLGVSSLKSIRQRQIGTYGQVAPMPHRPSEDAIESGEKSSGPPSDSALRLQVSKHQNPPELPMSNLWALPIAPYAYELIQHYIQTFARTFVPMNPQWESEWFKIALSDTACYHGTLFLSAAHRALLSGTGDVIPLECLQHKGEAIKIVNERLSDPRCRVADGTIAAIACLGAFETISGTPFEASVHVDGLEKLVKMRGGLKQLGMDGFLEQFLCWVDLSNATAVRKKPHFLPFESPISYSTYSDSETIWKYCDTQWDQEFLFNLPMKCFQGLDMIENRLFHRLRQLTAMIPSDPFIPNRTYQQAYINSVLLLERQIGVVVQERLAFKARFGELTLTPPACLFYIPSLIFCYMILRPTPVRSSIYGQFILRMKNHIDQLAPRQVFSRFPPDFWFWAMIIAGAASMGRPEQRYFQRITVQLCGILEVYSWQSAKEIMREFAWVDPVCDRTCKAFWDALEGTEESEGLEFDVTDHT